MYGMASRLGYARPPGRRLEAARCHQVGTRAFLDEERIVERIRLVAGEKPNLTCSLRNPREDVEREYPVR